jgi:hypothetical protein
VLKPNPNSGMNWNKWEEVELPPLPKTGDCRYCKHEQWEHSYDEKGNRACHEGMYGAKCRPTDSICLIVPRDYKLNACPCMEYVPGDNLAFLEWKSKRGF